MPAFGIVSEGYTDQLLLEGILEGFFKGTEYELSVKYLSPIYDETSAAQAQKSGWYQVFEYCKYEDNFARDFQYNDFIIVQIDTDISEEVHFEISKSKNGVAFTPEELTNLVIKKFHDLITPALLAKYIDRIIFAIAVHSIECWLLPEFGNTASDKKKTVNCIGTLNTRIGKKLGFTIDPANKSHNDNYEFFANNFASKRKKTLLDLGSKNPSFNTFLSKLVILFP